MPQSTAIPTPRGGVVFRRVPDGAVLYAPDTEIYFGLNTVGAEVWELLPPTSSSLDALIATLASRHADANPAQIGQDVRELLDDLRAQGLVMMQAAGDATSAPRDG